MTKVSFNSATINALHTAVHSKDKWVTTGLKVINKDNGFVRFIKIIFLPFARLFGKDPFSHVRSSEVALVIFAAFQHKKETLNEGEVKKVYQILEKLNLKSGKKYPIFTVLIPVVKKTVPVVPPLNPPAATIPLPTKTLSSPSSGNFEMSKKIGDQKVTFFHTVTHQSILEKDPAHEVFNKASKLRPNEINHITKMLDNPFFRSTLKTELQEFMEALERVGPDDDEIDTSITTTHPIFGRFFEEFKKTPSSQRVEWIQGTYAYLEQEILDRLCQAMEIKASMAGAKLSPKNQDTAEEIQLARKKKQDSHQIKKDQMIQQILIDPDSLNGIVKENKFYQDILIPLGLNSFSEYQNKHEEVVNWIHNGDDPSNPKMLETYGILQKAASQWVQGTSAYFENEIPEDSTLTRKNKQDSNQIKKDEMTQQIFIDPASLNGIVKKNLFYQTVLIPLGLNTFPEYQKAHEKVLNWIHNGDLTNPEMLVTYDLLQKAASQWNKPAPSHP